MKLLSSLFGISLFSTALSASALDIRSALTASVERSPEVAAASAELQAVQTSFKLAKRAYWPTLQLGVGSGDGLDEQSYEIRAIQPLFDWGARRKQILGERAQVDTLSSEHLLAEYRAFNDASGVYIQLYQTQRLLHIHHVFSKRLNELNRVASDRSSSGYGDRIEADRTALEIARTDQVIARLRGTLRSDAAVFETLTGLVVDNSRLVRPPSLGLLPLLSSGGNALADLIREAPVYQRAEAQTKAAGAKWQQARADRFPSLNIEASWEQREIGGRWESDSNIGLQFQYDTGPGFRRWGEATRTRQQFVAAEFRRDVGFRDLLRSTRNYLGSEPALEKRIRVLSRQVRHAKTVKVAYKEQFLAGTRDLEDLISIEREVFEAVRQRVELEGQLLKDQYQLAVDLGLLGRLLELEGA